MQYKQLLQSVISLLGGKNDNQGNWLSTIV